MQLRRLQVSKPWRLESRYVPANTSTLKQSEMSDSEDPLHIGTIVKTEFFEGNENQNPNQTSNHYVENMKSNQIEKQWYATTYHHRIPSLLLPWWE